MTVDTGQPAPSAPRVDTTQPTTPQFFIDRGATPEAAAALCTEHEMMCGRAGTVEQRAAMRHALGSAPQPPAPKPAPAHTASPAETAAALEAHTNAQLAAQLARDFAPARAAHHYRWETVDNPTPEQMEADTKLKEAFLRVGANDTVVNSIGQSLKPARVQALANETPEQTKARLDAGNQQLRAMWGKDYESNFSTLAQYLDRLDADPVLRDFMDRAALLFTPLDWNFLLQQVKYGSRATA